VRTEALAQQIARGEYVIDPHAVAEAMLRADFSAVLVAPQAVDGASGRVEQDEPGSGRDLA
jgi:Anti-sigma-28 factor, FlgM